MRVKIEYTGEIIDCDYEPECVVWTDDGGPYDWFASIDDWRECMLADDGVWYGTHDDKAFIDTACDNLSRGLRIHLTWYIIQDDMRYAVSGAWFFTTPLYINPKTDDWYYPDEVEAIDDGDI